MRQDQQQNEKNASSIDGNKYICAPHRCTLIAHEVRNLCWSGRKSHGRMMNRFWLRPTCHIICNNHIQTLSFACILFSARRQRLTEARYNVICINFWVIWPFKNGHESKNTVPFVSTDRCYCTMYPVLYSVVGAMQHFRLGDLAHIPTRCQHPNCMHTQRQTVLFHI